jgi:CMP-N-acetylneuraminic acid synthetase
LDTVVSVKGPYKKRDPILKRLRNGILEGYCDHENPEHIDPFYLYNASIYGAKRDYLLRQKRLVSSKQVPLIMDPYHSIDVDTELDFRIAEICIKHMESRREESTKQESAIS